MLYGTRIDAGSQEHQFRCVLYPVWHPPGLDGRVRGIPTGSTVLLAGASDAGGDAFTYTSLATLMLAKHRPEMVPNGIARRSEAIPDSVTYITLSHDRDHVYSELDAVLDGYQFEALTEHMTVADFSQRFMELLPVPERCSTPDGAPPTSSSPTQGRRTGSPQRKRLRDCFPISATEWPTPQRHSSLSIR